MINIYLYKNGTHQSIKPIFGDDIKLTIERGSGEMYRRVKFDGEITFLKSAYDIIDTATLDDEFMMKVFDRDEDGDDTTICEARFTKMDCRFDTDNKICYIKPEVVDEYDRLLSKMDDTYNLIDLAPAREDVTMIKRPILQVYMLGDNKLTNIIGNTSYEVDALEVTERSEMDNYHFGEVYRLISYNLKYDDTTQGRAFKQLYPDSEGVYVAIYVDQTTRFYNAKGYYFSGIRETAVVNSPIYNPQGVALSNLAVASASPEFTNLGVYDTRQSGLRVGVAPIAKRFTYARLIHDNDTQASHSETIPAEDITTNSLNFHYCIPVTTENFPEFDGKLIWSYEVQDEPTKWGVNGEGKYFKQPIKNMSGTAIPASDNLIPIGWSMWIPLSFWFDSNSGLDATFSLYGTEWILRDAIKLTEAIRVLLAQIDTRIKFFSTTAYSRFLFAATNPISNIAQTLYITPITNVKKTYYNQAAKKGDISLGQILDMLKSTFQCFWFLEKSPNTSEIHLRIEHIEWFKNGGSYTSDSRIRVKDLTALKSPKMGLPWDYCTNTFEYDKSLLTGRYEFGWASQCTEPFDGYAIDIQNKYTESAGTSSYKSEFISDLDYIMGAPNQMSDDLYALIAAHSVGGVMKTWVSRVQVSPQSVSFNVQNASLSNIFCINQRATSYWKYNLSGDLAYMAVPTLRQSAIIGDDPIRDVGAYLQVADVIRIRKQGVDFPIELDEVGVEGLIKTSLGDGEWIKMDIELFSLHATATLLFDTE